jgi:glutamate-1-semialdehyde 2,1-aminomutase
MTALHTKEPSGRAVDAYVSRTARSAELAARARQVLPGGSTRSYGFFRPYPLVFERGAGPYVWDVDGNRYVDYTHNGLSLIHGHAYPPVERAVIEALPKGTAWVGPSRPQIRYAEDLCARIPTATKVRFANTGTEATMLATKIARQATGRPLILKSWGAYHGSYDDLEAGLYGNGELPNRTALARFGDLASYEEAFARNPDRIAAVMVEPVLLTFRVVPPPPGFLPALADLARENGALVVLDDCLMFRLAVGGSAEKYGFVPDLTALGKFIGGGLPMGVVGAAEELMSVLDSRRAGHMYHGGSFNGNPLASTAGRIALRDLTAERIATMDAYAERLRSALRARAEELGLPLEVSGDGSVLGTYLLDEEGDVDREAGAYLHLAAVTRGIFPGPDGEMAMCTTLDDEAVETTIAMMSEALEETAEFVADRRTRRA